ncbi:hypothetical protein [Bosea rubneri]|uniref:Protease inhibitor Inh n=1 Tax=Bosea rubneri TaxID=3075434 RepID=A0ABU3S6A3_9HYPH|nr:hypothetical protein [Bosea sp. ZW T0_25]MDU0340241.1 hypothetical protein [Bosea sp. ZW T0_25]
MTASICRLTLLAASVATAALSPPLSSEVRAQASAFQGAWLEEGGACSGVFIQKGAAIAFRRPAAAFAPAFIIAGQRLATPLATCRIVRMTAQGARQMLNLSCTTTVSSDSARVVFALAESGTLNRYLGPEGGIATRYQRCDRDSLKPP